MTCPTCELHHHEAQCPDCLAQAAWAAQRAQAATWNRKGRPRKEANT
jgi:hypothetical protein